MTTSLGLPAMVLRNLHPPRSRRWPQRGTRCDFFTTATSRLRPRQPIGKIEPKRIVVELPDGSGGSIWKPIAVSGWDLFSASHRIYKPVDRDRA
jgi:hypothetical protein